MQMKAPEGATGASFEGENFEVVDGFITVPHEACAALMSHGYVPVEDHADDEKDEEVEVKLAQRRGRKSKGAEQSQQPDGADQSPAA